MNRHRLVLCLGTVLLVGCSRAVVPGPHFTCLPDGFGFDGHYKTTERVLPGRHIVEQRGYTQIGREDETANTILIMTLSGATTYESVLGTWSNLQEQNSSAELGPLQPLKLKGQEAWAWRVLWHEDERLIARDLYAVVSDKDTDFTYVLKFHASAPDYMDEALMERTLESFRAKAGNRVSMAKLSAVIALAAGFAFVFTRARGTIA